MVTFQKRRDLIKEAQILLGFQGRDVDGLDGPRTWNEIRNRTLGPNSGHTIPSSGPMNFSGRRPLVIDIQRFLRIAPDGLDGTQTWGAILDFLQPNILNIPSLVEPINGEKYPETIRGRSPNRNSGINERRGIIIHHCGGTFEGSISWILKPRTFAAYHCLVAPDGRRAILGEDTDCLHHAGVSKWRGRNGCNAFMLGISVTGDTVSGARRAQPALSAAEVASAAEWITKKLKKYNLTKADVTTHAVVSPGRKNDISESAYSQIMNAIP